MFLKSRFWTHIKYFSWIIIIRFLREVLIPNQRKKFRNILSVSFVLCSLKIKSTNSFGHAGLKMCADTCILRLSVFQSECLAIQYKTWSCGFCSDDKCIAWVNHFERWMERHHLNNPQVIFFIFSLFRNHIIHFNSKCLTLVLNTTRNFFENVWKSNTLNSSPGKIE